jgi:hypothetical protein
MLVNFEYKGRPAYAFTIFNFSQVKDAVLLVIADKKQQKSTMLFTYSNGNWETSEDLSFLSTKSFEQINNALTKLFKTYFDYYFNNDDENIAQQLNYTQFIS